MTDRPTCRPSGYELYVLYFYFKTNFTFLRKNVESFFKLYVLKKNCKLTKFIPLHGMQQSVCPNVGVIFSQKLPKNSHRSFTFKAINFNRPQNAKQSFGPHLQERLWQRTFKYRPIWSHCWQQPTSSRKTLFARHKLS